MRAHDGQDRASGAARQAEPEPQPQQVRGSGSNATKRPVPAASRNPGDHGPVQLLAWQKTAGNAAVTSLVRGRGPAASTTVVQRQLPVGNYRLTGDAELRNDDKEHTEVANLPRRSSVKVLDKGSRTSLFKTGWFFNYEHSWSETPNQRTGWIEDSKLDDSIAFELEDAFHGGRKPKLSQLQAIITRATPQQRKKAADNDAFLARAKAALDEDTYLGLLPALGVHRMPNTWTGNLSQGGKGHVTGAFADSVIRQHLQKYVADAMKAGRQVEGEVSVVDDEDFQTAFDRQWVHAAGQKQYIGQKASDVCNAFVDVNLPKRHIWVHRNMGDQGTVIHEGMHKYADPVLRDEQIGMSTLKKIDHGGTSRLDEGITEYFTRLVVGQLSMPQRVNYENEYRVADRLAQTHGRTLVAKAYFDGDFPGLKSAVGADWDLFAENLEGGKWNWLKANKYL
jgi:hypothetical protein